MTRGGSKTDRGINSRMRWKIAATTSGTLGVSNVVRVIFVVKTVAASGRKGVRMTQGTSDLVQLGTTTCYLGLSSMGGRVNSDRTHRGQEAG